MHRLDRMIVDWLPIVWLNFLNDQAALAGNCRWIPMESRIVTRLERVGLLSLDVSVQQTPPGKARGTDESCRPG